MALYNVTLTLFSCASFYIIQWRDLDFAGRLQNPLSRVVRRAPRIAAHVIDSCAQVATAVLIVVGFHVPKVSD